MGEFPVEGLNFSNKFMVVEIRLQGFFDAELQQGNFFRRNPVEIMLWLILRKIQAGDKNSEEKEEEESGASEESIGE